MEYNLTSEDKILVTVEYLASFFNRDVRTVQLWAKNDGMPKEEHGVYDLTACAKWKIAELLEEVEIIKTSGDKKTHAVKLETQMIINKEKKLKYLKTLGSLVNYDDVRIAWVGEMKIMRKALNSMVIKLDEALEGITDRIRRRKIIHEHVNEVLNHVSENLKIGTEKEEIEDLQETVEGELDLEDLEENLFEDEN
jgi:phage terminase Nu1 subunit (DNA packaging protein)